MRKLLLIILFSFLPLTADAAIAYDSACGISCGTSVGSGTSLSYTHTTGAANETFVIYFFHNRASTSDVTCTVDGHNATQETTITAVGTGYVMFGFVYNGASVQNPTIACSMTGGAGEMELQTGAYTGAPGGYDASGTNTAATNSLTTTVTTVADNTWGVMGGFEQGDGLTAGTNATKRSANSNNLTVFDSNAVIHPAGNFSMTFTAGLSDDAQGIVISISPTAAVTTATVNPSSRISLFGF